MNSNISNIIFGISTGYDFTRLNKKENEIKQGKNYYLSAFYQTVQLISFKELFDKKTHLYPDFSFKKNITYLSKKTLFCESILLNLICAVVKQGNYSMISNAWNTSSYLPGHLPIELPSYINQTINFFAENNGKIIRVGMFVNAIALIVFGDVACGSALLVGLSYQIFDELNLVPHSIKKAIETYLPLLSSIELFIHGSLIRRLLILLEAGTYIAPVMHRFFPTPDFLLQKTDQIARKIFSISGPSFKETSQPLIENKNLNAEQIKQILNDHEFNYVINPAYCSKEIIDLSKLPKNSQFSQLDELFNQVAWTQRYEIIKAKLADDDRFIDFIAQYFKESNKVKVRSQIDFYIEKKALEEKKTKEQFVVNYITQEMSILVNILEGKKHIEGELNDIEAMTSDCAYILPYLETLKNNHEFVEFEDGLLKLAIEGGSYCALGAKRAISDLKETVIQKARFAQNQTIQDPIQDYEFNLRQTLQMQRYQLIQSEVNKILMFDSFKQDIHAHDNFACLLKLGFYPVTQLTIQNMSILEIFLWELYASNRNKLLKIHRNKLNEVFDKPLYFADYVSRIIHANTQLTEDQKQEILETFTEMNNYQWSANETNRRFQRLALVMLGILKKA